jgi:hypothetical protein
VLWTGRQAIDRASVTTHFPEELPGGVFGMAAMASAEVDALLRTD